MSHFTIYQCDICRKKFTEQGKADNSIQIANGQTIFIQDVCDECLKGITEKLNNLGWKNEETK